MDGISTDSNIGSILAPDVTLTGDLSLAGNTSKVMLAAITGSEICLGGMTPTTLQLGAVTDTSIQSNGPLASLNVTSWTNSDGTDNITATWIGSLKSQGDFGAALQLTAAAAPGAVALRSANIMGNSTGIWSLSGKLSSLSVADNLSSDLAATDFGNIVVKGDISNADILAGTILGPTGPGSGDAFYSGSIGAIKVTGSVTRSLIAAGLDGLDDRFPIDGDDTLFADGKIGPISIGNSLSGSYLLASKLPATVRVGTTKVQTQESLAFVLP